MAVQAVTGASEEEVAEMRAEYEEQPLHEEGGIPFERAYCLTRISHQPDDYEGPERFCKNRTETLSEEEWHEHYNCAFPEDKYWHPNYDERTRTHTCSFHGRVITGHTETLEPKTAPIKHGIYSEDKHLRMDFTDSEQALYNGIVEQWPEAYGWPSEDEDPARYLLLRKVATNVVRTVRAEDYIDDEGEVHLQTIFNDQGEPVGEEPEENPIAGEYRLLVREITQMLKELGLTPKERSKMGAQEQSANALEEIGDAINEAIVGSDKEYDPDEFEDDDAD